MRKYIILFFSVLSFLYACSSGVPDGIIPPDEMTSLLTEVHLTDGRLSMLQQLPDTLYKYGAERYLSILKKYDTDTAQFRKSYLYYCSKPQQLIDINIKVLAVLQVKSDSLKKLMMGRRAAMHQGPVIPAPAFRHTSTIGNGPRYGPAVQAPIAPPNQAVPVRGGKVVPGPVHPPAGKNTPTNKAKVQ